MENLKKSRPIFDRPNALVAGGAGFLGSWLCEALLRTHKVVCVDDFSSGKRSNIEFLLQDPNFRFIKWDLVKPFDPESLQELAPFQIKFQGFQTIFNLACPTNVKDVQTIALKTSYANSIVVYNLLELAKIYDASFVHTSSASVYGNLNSDNPVEETMKGTLDPVAENNFYAEGKRFAESLVSLYARYYGVNAKIARIFNVYGPRTLPYQGRLIPDFVESIMKGEDLIIRGDESALSTFCYVEDATDGLIRLAGKNGFDVYNVGSPIPVQIKEIAETVMSLVGIKVGIFYDQNDTRKALVPSIVKAKKDLNWFPLTPLSQGMQATVDFIVSHRGLVEMDVLGV